MTDDPTRDPMDIVWLGDVGSLGVEPDQPGGCLLSFHPLDPERAVVVQLSRDKARELAQKLISATKADAAED